MPDTTCHMSISLDGFVAGADQSRDHPLGRGGREVHTYAREPIELEGGTSFRFVTEGFDAAYAQALAVAGEHGVDIAGGASTVRQALAAGVIDELTLDVVPVLLGAGERLFDGVRSFGLEPVEVLGSPLATHIRHRRRQLRRPTG